MVLETWTLQLGTGDCHYKTTMADFGLVGLYFFYNISEVKVATALPKKHKILPQEVKFVLFKKVNRHLFRLGMQINRATFCFPTLNYHDAKKNKT